MTKERKERKRIVQMTGNFLCLVGTNVAQIVINDALLRYSAYSSIIGHMRNKVRGWRGSR